jgi:hypothetical protein
MRCALALVLLISAAGYAKKYPFTPAPIVPAAAGDLNTGTDKNGNTEIRVKVRHLAKPEGLSPAKQVYMVWLQQAGGSPENAGLLKVNSKLEGTFETTTPYKGFDVIITAEDDPTVKAPSGPEVLRASVRP